MSTLYYKHSGKFSSSKLFLYVSLSILSCILVALIYSLIGKYNPFIYIQAIVTFFLVALLGIINSDFLLRSKVRNNFISINYSLVIGFATLYFSWMFWIYAIFDYKYSLLDVFLSSPRLLDFIVELPNSYFISVYSSKITGNTLLILWFLEAIFIIGGITYYTNKDLLHRVFCEYCENWCKIDQVFDLENKAEIDTIKRVMEAKNFSYLKDSSNKPNNSTLFIRLYIRKCSNCSNINTLTVSEVNSKTDSRGEFFEKEKEIISNLLLSPEEVIELSNICLNIIGNSNQI